MILRVNKRIRRYFKLAIKVAEQSEHQYKHGAVLVKGSKVINTAFNSCGFSRFARKFYPKEKKDWVSRHAELSVILNVPNKLTYNSIIFVVRINPQKQLRNSHPCAICISACSFVGIRKIIYSIDDYIYGIINL